jgi:hypothetical protein
VAESHVYAPFVLAALAPDPASPVDLLGHVLKAMLVSVAYVPDRSADAFLSTVRPHEIVAAAGYDVGGRELTGKSLVIDGYRIRLTCDPLAWPGATLQARYAVVYDEDSGPTDASRRLVGYVDCGDVGIGGAGPSVLDRTFQIVWASTGTFWWDVT